MKKIIFSAAVLAMAAIGVLKATSTNDYTFNELQMENIEALAGSEKDWNPCDNDPEAICLHMSYPGQWRQGYEMPSWMCK